MKIVINTRFLLAGKMEGIGWFSYEVARRIAAAQPEVEFIYAFDRAWDESFITSANIRPMRLMPPARHPFLFYAFFEWAMPRLLHKERADAFFSPDGFLSLSTPVPTLLTIHDLAYRHFPNQVGWLAQKYYQRYMPKFAHRADRITTVSSFTKADISAQFGVNADKIDVVYNGFNEAYAPIDEATAAEVRQKYTGGAPFFIYVGSIHPRKNVANLLRAFDAFKSKQNSPLKLVLVGRMAWQTGEVGEVLAKMQYRNEVIMLGYVGIAELPQLVAVAFANVYVSLFEGFGIPILEAMRSGVPVITSDTSSMPEVAGDAGILVNPHSVTQIADAMQKIYMDSDLRQNCIEKGIIQSQNFGWDKTAQKVWSSLSLMLEERKRDKSK